MNRLFLYCGIAIGLIVAGVGVGRVGLTLVAHSQTMDDNGGQTAVGRWGSKWGFSQMAAGLILFGGSLLVDSVLLGLTINRTGR